MKGTISTLHPSLAPLVKHLCATPEPLQPLIIDFLRALDIKISSLQDRLASLTPSEPAAVDPAGVSVAVDATQLDRGLQIMKFQAALSGATISLLEQLKRDPSLADHIRTHFATDTFGEAILTLTTTLHAEVTPALHGTVLKALEIMGAILKAIMECLSIAGATSETICVSTESASDRLATLKGFAEHIKALIAQFKKPSMPGGPVASSEF